MPIEFRCNQCDKLLRVPEGTAGKTARCPQCGALVVVPEPAAAAVSPGPIKAAPEPPAAPHNPFSSPATTQMQAPPDYVAREFAPTRIDVGDVMGRAWRIYKQHWLPCLGVCVLVFFVSLGLGGVLGAAAQNSGGLARLATNLLTQIVGLFLNLGLMTYMLKTARGEAAAVTDLFSAGQLLPTAIGIMILYALAVLGGLILLVIPGIIFALMFSFSFFVLIEQRTDVIESMRRSAMATHGNKLSMFGLWIISGILTLLGFFACFVGSLFVYPYVMLLFAVTYLAATGQSTAADYERQTLL